MATPFHLPVTAAQVGTYFVGQYYQLLQQQPDFVHQFYNEASTMLRIDGNSRETATTMLVWAIKTGMISTRERSRSIQVSGRDYM